MWNRKDLKSRAKISFKRNYWKSVLVSFIFMLFVGGGVASSVSSGASEDEMFSPVAYTEEYNVTHHDGDDMDDLSDMDYEDWVRYGEDDVSKELAAIEEEIQASGMDKNAWVVYFVTFLIVFFVVFLIVTALMLVIDAFLCNPVEVGCNRFYFKNLSEPALVKEVTFAFDHNYKNVVKTMFFRDLFTFLWTLLFIIPGIVKSYEYQMIPYLLADNPQMTKEQAFAESKRMMTGQKWRAFVLDLSFLGWRILSVFTFGILNIFYVQPYMDSTHAALYEALRYGTVNENINTSNIQ